MFAIDLLILNAIKDYLISISFLTHTVKGGLTVVFFAAAYGWAMLNEDCLKQRKVKK